MTLPSGSASSQQWNAATYADNAHFVPALGQPVLDLLQPQPGERILDLGCGDGALTEKLVALGAQVVGIDRDSNPVAFFGRNHASIRGKRAYRFFSAVGRKLVQAYARPSQKLFSYQDYFDLSVACIFLIFLRKTTADSIFRKLLGRRLLDQSSFFQ